MNDTTEARCAVNDGTHVGWRAAHDIGWGQCYACKYLLLRTEQDDGHTMHVHEVPRHHPSSAVRR